MASRFDQIPTFNPFIQDAPWEMLSQVALSRQQRYYEGVQAVQSYVDKVAGLPVIKDVDKQYLNNRLTQLGNDISKVAGEDFSNPFLVSKLGNLAHGVASDPKLQNAVIGSKQVLEKKARIQELRAKNPELYNPNNEAYSMIDINRWLTDGTAGSALADNHSYYDYYDYSKEVRDAMKDFKPTKISRKLPKGEWLHSFTDASWTDPEVREYLNGVLSERAKQQMRINGTVAFIGRDEDLLSAYYSDLKEKTKANNVRIKDYQAKMTAENSDVQALMKSKINELKEQNLEYIDLTGKIDQRDLDFFNANKENIAGRLFSDGYLSGVTRGYSHADIEEEYDPNEIWKTKFSQSMENSRLNTRLAFDAQQNALDRKQREDLKLLDLGYKYYKDGKLKNLSEENALDKAKSAYSEEDLSRTGRAVFDSERSQLDSSKNQAFKTVREKLLQQSPQLRDQFQKFLNVGGQEFTNSDPSWIATQQYLTSQASIPKAKRDVWANEYIEEINRLNTRQEVLNQQEQDVERVISREFGRDLQKLEEMYKRAKPVTFTFTERAPAGSRNINVDQKVTLDPQKIKNILLTQPSGPIRNNPNDPQDRIDYEPGPGGHLNIRIGGKFKSYSRGAIPEELRTIIEATNNNKELQKRAEERRNQLYGQSVLNLGDWWTPTGDKDPRISRAVNYISNQVGGKPEEFSIARVNRTTGEIQFRLNPQGGPQGKTTNIDRNIIESLGLVEDKVNGTYTMKGLDYFKRDFTGVTPTEQELIMALEGNVNIPKTSYYTPPNTYDPNGNGQFVQIVKDVDAAGNPRYWLRSENYNVTLDYQDFQDPISAINAAKALTADPIRMQKLIDQKIK